MNAHKRTRISEHTTSPMLPLKNPNPDVLTHLARPLPAHLRLRDATLADLPWRLTIAGELTRDRDAAARLDTDIARYALGDRIAALGAVSPERLAALYADADLFVLASRFEGYGMAYAEAIAHGLPVIGSDAGAIPVKG